MKVFLLAAAITGAVASRKMGADVVALSNASANFVQLQQRKRGNHGLIDYIYTFGAPGTASPALVNQHGSELCFQGLRTYLTEGGSMWGRWIDAVPYITYMISMYHAHYPVRELDVHDPDKYQVKRCRQEPLKNGTRIWEMPVTGSLSQALHKSGKYVAAAKTVGHDWFTNMTIFATLYAYMHNNLEVAALAQRHGWKLIGYARESGEHSTHGPQVSHLFQQDSTLDCTVTFQGTDSTADWWANFEYDPAHFCGFADADEKCIFEHGACKMRHPRGAFVHEGFASRLRAIVGSCEWKEMIKPNLQFCRNVYAVGHSLGGALAELFTACVSKELKPGEYGFEDHALLSWASSARAAGPLKMETTKYTNDTLTDELFGEEVWALSDRN